MTLNSPGELAGFIGAGIVGATGGSIILLALVIIMIEALLLWKFKATMGEGYLFVFITLLFLRIFMNDSSFNDVGIFAMLHNLILFGSALIWAKLLTSGPDR